MSLKLVMVINKNEEKTLTEQKKTTHDMGIQATIVYFK